MQAANNRNGYHLPVFRRVYGTRFGAIILESLMGAIRVIVTVNVLAQYTMEMSFTENDDMVQTLAPQGADNAFAESIHHRRFSCRDNLFDIHHTGSALKSPHKTCVAVMNEESRCSVIREGIGELPRCPLGTGGSGDVEVNDSSARMLDEYQNMQRCE